MIRYLTDERIDGVIDAGYDNLKAKNYADGILEMLNETESYLEDGIPSDSIIMIQRRERYQDTAVLRSMK